MPQIQDCPTSSEPPNAKGVSRSRWVGPGICIFETPFPLPGPPTPPGPRLPRHGWAVLPPWVITALPQTHAQEMKYSSRTYWLLQRLLGKANETDSRKEMSVRHGRGAGGGTTVRTRVGATSLLQPLSDPTSGSRLHLLFLVSPPYHTPAPNHPYLSTGPRAPPLLLEDESSVSLSNTSRQHNKA